ncbi:MAG: glycosyltransferase family 2 protein [Bryobacterales bacterium]|nr:glycosyltransferase family 2 protein [Bryobacterales bacterium]
MILSAHSYLDLRTALIIPALNEEESLPRLLRSLPPSLFQLVVVADNGSTDNTREVARRGGALVVTQRERGYGAACLAAIRALPTEIDTIVFLQADCSEDPTEAQHLLLPIAQNQADLVIGSRTLGNAEAGSLEPHQVFGNRLATTLVRWIWGHRYTDLGPFRAIRRDALDLLDMKDRNYGWTVEMQVKAVQRHLRIQEVPVSYFRRVGNSKISGNLYASIRAGWKILTTIFALRILEQFRRH